jgi:RimJ/RimL family protein N-acetyltransferase
MGSDIQFPFRVDCNPLALRVGGWSRIDGSSLGLHQRLKLRDGRVVAVRPLERRDRRLLEVAIRQLSDESRYLRFGTPKPHLPERELDRLVDIDHHADEALLAIDPLSGRGVAVVRYVLLPDDAGVVEVAATVADDWQGIGLGTALLAQLAGRACDEGHSELRAYVLADNRRSLAMLRRAGFTARPATGPLREYELILRGFVGELAPTVLAREPLGAE